ncbi:MAG: FAD-dependent oxidoreductase [Hyphomicrobiaceae bacterium]|nr:FAD-dependent oxidoreductase [Hyphomicrobiaceae bacterium]
MQTSKIFAQFHYTRSPDQDVVRPARHPVVVVGAGPIGLAFAVDLAQRGHKVVVLDDSDRIGDGSRAICFAKRTLEIFDRLGVGEQAVAKGVVWQKGRVFHREQELYAFDLLPEAGHKMPAFINLQQYYVEGYLVDRAIALSEIDIRWRNRVVGVERRSDGATVSIETPDGPYTLAADWVIACDGARSPLRAMLGLDFKGEQFEDQFLIADVKMTADFPVERWFWFEPPFHPGQSALLHKQPDDIWRIDLQLSPDADTDHERRPEIVRPRIEKMLGHSNFELDWVSIYRFQCRRLERFAHGRVIFAGDAAHQVSPFGARGANSGVQDTDNLAWKLALVLEGLAPPALLNTYNIERSEAADENILNSTRSTDFIAPHSPMERTFRNGALALAGQTEFGKRFVNSGRLSLPTAYTASPLSTEDCDVWAGGPRPGAPVPDAELRTGDDKVVYLLNCLGRDFTLLSAGPVDGALAPNGVKHVCIGPDQSLTDTHGYFARRFDAQSGSAYLVRPDGHVAARFKMVTAAGITQALRRARGEAV